MPSSVHMPEENGATFLENAILKARSVCLQTGQAALADDSGLVVTALAGAPGIYSARYAGLTASDEDNRQALLAAMASVAEEHRQAQFVCALAVAFPDGRLLTAEGVCHGEVLTSPRGDNGFGYDALFYYPPLQCSFAELTTKQKNQISHRSQALDKLLKYIRNDSHSSS